MNTITNWKTDDGQVFHIYPKSVHKVEDTCVFLINTGAQDCLVAESVKLGFVGETVKADGADCVKAELTHENAVILRKLFPFTAPVRVLEREKTVGVGDRLGIACDGHIRVFQQYPHVTPVFAQQSIRELTLTNRNYDDVLDCVSYAVFRNDYQAGFGADGDHLKTAEEVKYALGCGYTMITLDCSEQIDNTVNAMTDAEVDAKYIPDAALEARYLKQDIDVGEGVSIKFDTQMFRRTALIYGKAIDHAANIYHSLLCTPDNGQVADFEISIDETSTPTLPEQHFFVANELALRGVHYATIAPRFCGEFQKGVDYIGDLNQFHAELKVHSVIARHFGYKLSVHSGSDKFSIFNDVGEQTRGRFHLKTAGTNWLEAMRLVAQKDPAMYREIHEFALGVFEEARRYYHVTTDLTKIPNLDTMKDVELPDLFGQNDARQLIHITYGLILNARNADGSYRFKDRLYQLWRTYANDYSELLYRHIGNHVKTILCED